MLTMRLWCGAFEEVEVISTALVLSNDGYADTKCFFLLKKKRKRIKYKKADIRGERWLNNCVSKRE